MYVVCHVMDRHDNLLMILTNFYVNCGEATGTYTETIEATGTPAAGVAGPQMGT